MSLYSPYQNNRKTFSLSYTNFYDELLSFLRWKEQINMFYFVVSTIFGTFEKNIFKVWNMMFFYKSDGDVGRVFRI